MAPPRSLFLTTVVAATLLLFSAAPLRAGASAFPEALDAGEAYFSDEALAHLSESLTKFISDVKDLAARAVDSLRTPEEYSLSSSSSSRNSLAALLAADPFTSPLPPWPASASAFASVPRERSDAITAAPRFDDEALEALEALAAAGADTALFAPILGGEENAAAVVAVAVDEFAADGGVEASAVSVSSVPRSPASTLSTSSHLDAALDIQYGEEATAGASAAMRRVAGWVSSLGDSAALVAAEPPSRLGAARGAVDAAADAIEAVGASLAAALESSPGADDAELDLAVSVDVVVGGGGRSGSGSGRRASSEINNDDGDSAVVDVRIEASAVPGSGITGSMLAEALEGASLDAVAAAGAAGVEVVAASVDVFDDEEEEDEIDDDLSSSSLFSYSQREDAFCLYLGNSGFFSKSAAYDRWVCARRAPLSRALAATSLFFAAASAVVAFNALVSSSDDDDEESDSDSEGGEEKLDDETADEETALFIKPALWALDSKA